MMTPDEIKTTQTALNKLGYGLDVDGYWGRKTNEAYKDYLAKKVKPKVNLSTVLAWLPVILSLSQGKVNMNSAQALSGLRWVITVVGSLAVAKGIGDAAGWEIVGSAVVAIAPVVWSWFIHKK